MFKYLLFLTPLVCAAGTVYYTDEPPQQEEQEKLPKPLFNHPELEPEFKINEQYYFEDKKNLKKKVYRKESSFFEFDYGLSDLEVKNVTPKYYAQNYTQVIPTSTSGSGSSSSSVTSTTLVVRETFSIIDYGTFTYTFPSDDDTDPTKQDSFQVNMVGRSKNWGYGMEISYDNHPTITLTHPHYQIVQTQTSTTTSTSTSASGQVSTSTATTVPVQKTADVIMDTATMKVVNVPIHLTAYYFPIYDGYFQPYLKGSLGINYSKTTLSIDTATENSIATMVPLYQEGWGFMPYTWTFGIGCHIMLSENWALNVGYDQQRIDGRSTRFCVTVSDPANPTSSSNGPYGDMRLEFEQRRKVYLIGLAYYS